jgi:hypothetical protein
MKPVSGRCAGSKRNRVHSVFWQNEAKFANVFNGHFAWGCFSIFWSSWRIETLAEVLVCLPQRSEAMLVKDARNKGISEHCLRRP